MTTGNYSDSDSEEQSSCVDKLVFDTEKQAKTAATVAEHQRGAKLKVYRCRSCHLWHLSSAYN